MSRSIDASAAGRSATRPTHEPYFSVTPGGPGQVKIFYAVSYVLDCGSPRINRPYSCASHADDSEFIEVVAAHAPGYPASRWFTSSVFLSAHWRSDANESARYDAADVQWADGKVYSRPHVRVAHDKHANYRTQAACDAGVSYYDNRDNPQANSTPADVPASANLGQSFAPFIGHAAAPVYSRRGSAGYEYYWLAGERFNGWLTPKSASAAGPYYDSSLAFGY